MLIKVWAKKEKKYFHCDSVLKKSSLGLILFWGGLKLSTEMLLAARRFSGPWLLCTCRAKTQSHRKTNLVSVCNGWNNGQETEYRQENWIFSILTFREVQTNSICSAKVSHSPPASMHYFKEMCLHLIILLESINIINITCGQFCKFFIGLLPAC